jgi:hypothetical protein
VASRKREADGGRADTPPAAEEATALLVLDNLEHLVEGAPVPWHLVRQAPRVKLVESYAAHQQAGRPEERARMTARHAAHFAAYVQERAADLRRSRRAVAELERERPNVLAAWQWAAAQGQVDLLERLRPGLLLVHQLVAATTHMAVGVEAALHLPPAPPPGGAGVEPEVRELALAAP